MSKLAPLLVVGTGAAAASVGGFYLLSRFNTQAEESVSSDLTTTTLQAFKDAKGGPCTKKYFPNLGFSNLGTAIDSTHKIDGTTFSSETSAPESCLVVNWERTDSTTTGDTNKWKGNFRFEWTFFRGNKGFVMFYTTKTSSSASTLDLEGGIYVVEKNSASGSWSITKNKELSGKNLNTTSFDNNFPQPGEQLTDLSNKAYWGFIAPTDDLSKVCTSSDTNCPTTPTTEKTFKGSWLWAQDETKADGSLTKWIKEPATVLENLFTKGEIDLNAALASFKGSWKKSELRETPTATPQ